MTEPSTGNPGHAQLSKLSLSGEHGAGCKEFAELAGSPAGGAQPCGDHRSEGGVGGVREWPALLAKGAGHALCRPPPCWSSLLPRHVLLTHPKFFGIVIWSTMFIALICSKLGR